MIGSECRICVLVLFLFRSYSNFVEQIFQLKYVRISLRQFKTNHHSWLNSWAGLLISPTQWSIWRTQDQNQIMMSRRWWLRENWKKLMQKFFDKFRSWWLRLFSTEIQKSLSESLNSNFPVVVISYPCEDFAAVFDKTSRAIIKTHQNYFFLQCK